MANDFTAKLARRLPFILIAVLVGAAIGWVQVQQSPNPARSGAVAGSELGGDFTLTNQDGNPFTDEDLKGHDTLIYFGFTYCPAICPTELQKMSRVMKILGDQADALQLIFITVDPERDTPAVIKSYLSLFNPRFIGLTGTKEQIEHVKKLYRVYAAKVQEEGMSDYTVDHSSFIYFFGPEGTLLGLYRIEDTAEDMAGEIGNQIMEKIRPSPNAG